MAWQKQASLEAALKKANLTFGLLPGHVEYYWVEGKGSYDGTFIIQSAEVSQMHSKRKTDVTDSQSDYFPGSFHNSIKSFVSELQEA